MIPSQEAIQKMAAYRQRIQAGEQLTLDEYREILAIKRADRQGVTQPKAGSRAKKAPQVIDVAGDLEAFGGM